MDNLNFIMMSLQGKVAPDKIIYLKDKIARKNNADLPMVIAQAGLKDKVTTLLLAIFLGGLGAHRFYIGDTRLALAFLISNILTYILLFVGAFISPVLYTVMAFAVGAIAIWQFVDIFISYKRVKTINFNRLNYVLDMLPDAENAD